MIFTKYSCSYIAYNMMWRNNKSRLHSDIDGVLFRLNGPFDSNAKKRSCQRHERTFAPSPSQLHLLAIQFQTLWYDEITNPCYILIFMVFGNKCASSISPLRLRSFTSLPSSLPNFSSSHSVPSSEEAIMLIWPEHNTVDIDFLKSVSHLNY